ncbi:MAG: hypothetical protein ACRD4G_11160 [Bryobacteraceae bacterium]
MTTDNSWRMQSLRVEQLEKRCQPSERDSRRSFILYRCASSRVEHPFGNPTARAVPENYGHADRRRLTMHFKNFYVLPEQGVMMIVDSLALCIVSSV